MLRRCRSWANRLPSPQSADSRDYPTPATSRKFPTTERSPHGEEPNVLQRLSHLAYTSRRTNADTSVPPSHVSDSMLTRTLIFTALCSPTCRGGTSLLGTVNYSQLKGAFPKLDMDKTGLVCSK
jgi:hypothetical protein